MMVRAMRPATGVAFGGARAVGGQQSVEVGVELIDDDDRARVAQASPGGQQQAVRARPAGLRRCAGGGTVQPQKRRRCFAPDSGPPSPGDSDWAGENRHRQAPRGGREYSTSRSFSKKRLTSDDSPTRRWPKSNMTGFRPLRDRASG